MLCSACWGRQLENWRCWVVPDVTMGQLLAAGAAAAATAWRGRCDQRCGAQRCGRGCELWVLASGVAGKRAEELCWPRLVRLPLLRSSLRGRGPLLFLSDPPSFPYLLACACGRCERAARTEGPVPCLGVSEWRFLGCSLLVSGSRLVAVICCSQGRFPSHAAGHVCVSRCWLPPRGGGRRLPPSLLIFRRVPLRRRRLIGPCNHHHHHATRA